MTLWVTYLCAYVTFTTVRGALLAVPDYPYSFVDLAELGWGGLLINVALLAVAFSVLGLMIVGIDRAMPARARLGGALAHNAEAPDEVTAIDALPGRREV